jgi:hypothetical protein
MISRPDIRCFSSALALTLVLSPVGPAAHGKSKPDEKELLTAPSADLISAEDLAPAVQQSVANGVATLIARITAEDNPWSVAFPPLQRVRVDGYKEVKAKRVESEHPVYEQVEVEMIEEVIESGKRTGRFHKVKRKVNSNKKIGTTTHSHLTPDPNGTEMMKVPIYAKDGPAVWRAYLPGLNGMALYVLAKAGLGEHPATVAHAAALAEQTTDDIGLPDLTFDVAWMAAGFAALGPDSPHEKLARRLLSKLIDGQIKEKGDLEGLWGPVCVNFTYFGKLMTIGQMILHELNEVIPKKMQTATPAEQKKIIALGKDMKAFASIYEKTQRDVFRAGTRLKDIVYSFNVSETLTLPGLPFNAYQWVVSDVESTEAAAFAIAVGKKAGLLPRETQRGEVKGKKVVPPLKTDAVLRTAAKRLAAAIDEDGGATALAFATENKALKDTGFPAPLLNNDKLPQQFDIQTARTCVAAQDAIESLVAADASLGKGLSEPRKRAHDRAAQIAARWYKESANPAADAWKGIYMGISISHADLEKSRELPSLPSSESAVEALPWGPPGSLYRIVPGFRGLFADADAKDRYKDDLFRQIAYRLVALQDQSGQWSGTGSPTFSTAVDSAVIDAIAFAWHHHLNREGELKNVPDPIPYQVMLDRHHGNWMGEGNNDAAMVPTLASLVFLVEAIEQPVSLDGIAILPETATEPDPSGKPDIKRTPVGAAQSVARPNVARTDLFGSLVGAKRAVKTVVKSAGDDPAVQETAPKPAKATVWDKKDDKEEEGKEYDGLGKLDSLLEPAEEKE